MPKQKNGPTPISKATKPCWCPINLSGFKLIKQSVFELESGNQNILDEGTPKTGKWTVSNFESNQALVVSNNPIRFQVILTNCL